MSYINTVLDYLGEPYTLGTTDGEPVILRDLGDYEFEISGLRSPSAPVTLYVWYTKTHRELIGIYTKIHSKEDLKDILGYYATKYQNLCEKIQVEREDKIE